MRGKLVLVIMCGWIGMLVSACVTKATEDELEIMCDNLVKLRGEISKPSSATIESDISVKFTEETKKLQESQMSAENSLNDEMQTKLEAAQNDEEKVEIQKEYAAKMEALKAKLKPELEAMNTQKQAAIEEAKEEAEANEAAWRTAVDECLTDAKKESVSQEVARCRIQATTTDKYWNGCR